MQTEKLNLFLLPVDQSPQVPIENKKLLTASKADLSLMASDIIAAVDDGNADGLDTVILAKKMAYVADSVIEGMKGKVRIPQPKDYSKHHVDIAERTTGAKWYFDGCKDPIWTELNIKLAQIKDEIADREAWLKTLKEPYTVEGGTVDEDTGEVAESYVVYPPVKTGAQSLIFSLK